MRAVLDELYALALAAYPAECCGYVLADPDEVVPCANAALIGAPETSFAIDGTELIAFAKSFRTPRPARVVYHSHTNGRAYFSATDAALAGDTGGPAYPVDHLVIGVDASRVTEAARFSWSDAARAYVEIARWAP